MICANSRFELIWLSWERSKLKSISVKGVITRKAFTMVEQLLTKSKDTMVEAM